MKLHELISQIKEEKLPREKLESYGDQLSSLFAEMCLEVAEREKEEALFMADEKMDKISVAQRKILWKATSGGQREIVLKRYLLATKEMILSLKSRVYRLIF